MRASFLMILAGALLASALAAPVTRAVAFADPEAGPVARAMLARTLKVAEDRITVVETTPVDWPDASLGCPEKGMMYAQMITAGHRVRLAVDGKTYEVHVAGTRAVMCGAAPAAASSDRPAPSHPAAAARLSRAARKDLAEALKIPVEGVKVTSVRPTNWPDQRLGCPGPVPSQPQPTSGFLLELTARGKRYRYHADLERVVRCD